MASHIDAHTLREWLDAKRPVTVLDIRTNDARAEWSIPGSIHVNAYEDVREGRPSALAQAELPPQSTGGDRLQRGSRERDCR
jgi:rhodanese-related sulfurtransferase